MACYRELSSWREALVSTPRTGEYDSYAGAIAAQCCPSFEQSGSPPVQATAPGR